MKRFSQCQIAVYRAGVSPLHPTKGLFEKSPLESQKLLINNIFLKVLGVKPLFQKGLAGSRGWPLALPDKPKFEASTFLCRVPQQKIMENV
jgi:hypothetical protein